MNFPLRIPFAVSQSSGECYFYSHMILGIFKSAPPYLLMTQGHSKAFCSISMCLYDFCSSLRCQFLVLFHYYPIRNYFNAFVFQ
jgi:hypothetical protein